MIKNNRTFVAIPTGPPKKYALPYMFAALKMLDYDDMEIHFAVTRYKGDFKSEEGFPEKIKEYVDVSEFDCEVHIHYTWVTEQEFNNAYLIICRNLQLLRGLFLDGDCGYFLLLGGDNPPPVRTIKHLKGLGVDVACGLLYQRPDRRKDGTPLPMVYYPSWMLHELPDDLPPQIMDEFEKAWLHSQLCIPLYIDPNPEPILTEFANGTGCTLIKRKVLENVGFYLPPELYHSEDIHFFLKCMLYGYSMACDLTFHAPHLHEDGSTW